jgi:hypothetical protein
MDLKTIKVTIFIIVFVLFISIVFSGGNGTSFDNRKMLVTPPGFEKCQGSTGSLYHPILTVEEPKMYFMIEDEEGNEIIVDMPKDINEKEIENRIIQKIKEESGRDETIEKKENEFIKEKEPEESPPDEPNGNPEQEESTKVVLLKYYLSEGYLDGYLFCDENESLHFDASYLFFSYRILKYEWDFDGDGSYEKMSDSAVLSHKYAAKGIYNLHIRITYSYNYSYYPVYFDVDDSYNGNYQVQIINTGKINDTPESGSLNKGISLNTWDNVDREYIAPTIVEFQNSIEYEIKVSVGSKESGYPPILDFELSCEVEDEGPIDENDEGAFQIKISPVHFGIQPEFPIIRQPIIVNPGIPSLWRNITNLNENDTSKSSIAQTIHVKVKDVKNDEISYLDNYKVEFNASKTIDQNEGTIFSWDFGDGEFGEGTEVSHIYAHRGTYTTTLTAKGWNHSISKTFVVRRGFEDPKQVIVTNYYTKPVDNYLICHVNESMIFDIFELVRYVDLYWVEWDFDSDGIYEVNVTSSWITKTFYEPGYFEVSFRYTYSCRGSRYVLWNIGSFSTDEENHEKSVISYNSNTNWIKIVVKGEDNAYPLIPDFTTQAPNGFSWWNQEEFLENYYNINEQKCVTYLKYYSSWNNRLNSWKNPVTFNANSTLIPKGTTHDDFFYFWDFGDGETATGIEVSHEFENPQNDYQVKLTVWNDKYNVSVIKMVAPRPSSPNIYLYRETSGYDTIRVIVDGRVTKAVPMVELGTEIVWKDVFIENGKLYFDGKCYDFLYYEELLNEPRTSNYGWILERDEEGRLFLDGELLSLEELKDFFRTELTEAGLFENEIEDFIDEWLGEGARLFPGQKPFHYAIMYVPENIIDEIIQIETEKEYDEIIRVHFLIQPVGGDIHLVPPQYPKPQKGGNILHEWGVYIGDSIPEKEEDNNQSSWFDNFIEGYCDFQMCILNEDIMKSIKSTYRSYQLDLTRIQMLPINLP